MTNSLLPWQTGELSALKDAPKEGTLVTQEVKPILMQAKMKKKKFQGQDLDWEELFLQHNKCLKIEEIRPIMPVIILMRVEDLQDVVIISHDTATKKVRCKVVLNICWHLDRLAEMGGEIGEFWTQKNNKLIMVSQTRAAVEEEVGADRDWINKEWKMEEKILLGLLNILLITELLLL